MAELTELVAKNHSQFFRPRPSHFSVVSELTVAIRNRSAFGVAEPAILHRAKAPLQSLCAVPTETRSCEGALFS
jgi:hypothetical protein